MNLYKIKVLHAAPRGSHESIEKYMLAENDREIYERIDKELNYGSWADAKRDGDREFDYEKDKDIPHEEWIMQHCGELENEDFSDAYYGITRYGWENLGPIEDLEVEVLLKRGIVKKI